jgi:hypothetical protein
MDEPASAPALTESPLIAQLRQIGSGEQSLPPSFARRHHFVPAFALAQFAQPPGTRDGWLHQLDVRSGRPQRTRPDDAAFVRDLYTYEDRNGELSKSVEAFFSIVESHAAVALDRLRVDPDALSPQDRETIAFFLALQESRTPEGLIRAQQMRQVAFEIKASMDLSNAESFRRAFASEHVNALSLAEAEELRLRLQQQLLDGRVSYEAPRTGAMKQIVSASADLAASIYSLDWTVLVADGDAEFVTSDRPISMVDLTPEYPWSGNAWNSSPGAISFYPLSPGMGLFIKPGGDCGYGLATSGPDQVRRLNLMTYGWAERFIYGRSQEVVCRVRRQASSHASEVARRRPPKQVILVPGDVFEPSVTAEYVRRGWPRRILVTDDDGRRRAMSYVVINFDDPPGVAARTAMEIAEAFNSTDAV